MFGSASFTFVRAATEAAFVSAAWAIGRAMRSAAAYNERHAKATVQEERLRIARELHDVVAHSMSVIAVQAGVGNLVIRDRPEEAEKALAVIETTSRESLTEMRRLLDMLREERPGDLLPSPGLADLPQLAGQTRRAELEVDLAITGEPRDLPAGAGLAACPATRIIMLTTFGADEYVYRALRAGASGFLLKDLPPADLLNAIRVVADGDALLAPAVTRRLYLSMGTVKTHIGRLLAKLDARDRAQLVIAAYDAGLPRRR